MIAIVTPISDCTVTTITIEICFDFYLPFQRFIYFSFFSKYNRTHWCFYPFEQPVSLLFAVNTIIMIFVWFNSNTKWVSLVKQELQTILEHLRSPWLRRGFAPGFVYNNKGALDSQPQVIKFTSCLPMVGGSLRVLRLLPPLKRVAII